MARSDGGPARHALEVNFALNSAGLKVQLVSITAPGTDSLLTEMSTRPDFPAMPPRAGAFGSLRTALREARAIAKYDVLILHGYYLWWIPVAVLVATFYRTPIFVMPHGSLTTFDRGRSRLKKRLFWLIGGGWLVDIHARFLVASTLEKFELPRSIKRARVTVVGAGAQTPDIEVGGAPEPHSPVRLLTLSRLAPKKRIDLVLAALHVLRESGRAATLTIAGSGDRGYEMHLRRITSDLGLDEHVAFAGSVGTAEKSILLTEADVFVLPSDDENFGLAFAEASVHALPAVVSTRVGAATALPPEAGVRLEAPTAQSIALAVESILANHSAARAATRRFAVEEFSWDSVASRWLDALANSSRVRSRRTSLEARKET
nr:glycosyltransferase [Microbacterium sp. CFBP 13617]